MDRLAQPASGPDVDLVLRAYEAFAHADIDRAVADLHPDVEWIEPDEFPNGGRRQGPEAVAGYLRDSRAMWAELRSEPTAHRRGDEIVVVHRLRGRLADGTWHDVTVADVFTVKDGRVLRMRAYADPQEALREEGHTSTTSRGTASRGTASRGTTRRG